MVRYKKFLAVFAAAVFILSFIFYLSGLLLPKAKTAIHYFGAPAVKINKIKLEIIYFVPKDQTPANDFYDIISDALKEVKVFHIREFKGQGGLKYVIYPKPVIGEEISAFYDGSDTSRGNPNAIRVVFLEMGRRMFRQNGDLYDSEFSRRQKNELPIRVFVYQGVGASSGVLNVIVSYDYFKRTNYGASVLYHELLHNLGVPDAYEYSTGAAQSDDIMGSGREKPLLETYIRDEIKNQMLE